MNASSVPAGGAESETSGSSQRGAVDASSVPVATAESDLKAASTNGTDQGNGEDSPAIMSGRAAHERSDWGWPLVTVHGRTRVRVSDRRVNSKR